MRADIPHSVVLIVKVTAEGGLDAAMEAPFVFAAIDALAARATAWAERRQRLLIEACPADGSLQSPEEAGAAAAAAVKNVIPAAESSAHSLHLHS